MRRNIKDVKKAQGYFGQYGGRYVPEILISALDELEKNYMKSKNDKKFHEELSYYLKNYAGRPTPLYFAARLTKYLGGAKIYLKREDLCHLGAEVIEVSSGSKTLKDAVNEAIRYWVSNIDDTYYVLGSVVGPHPYPTIVRDFQKIIGIEQ